LPGRDQIFIFQAALLANIDRADVPAAVAFYALGEFFLPALEPILQIQDVRFYPDRILADFPWRKRRSIPIAGRRTEIRTLGWFPQIGRAAGQGKNQDFLRVDLVPFDQFL
jgi:hypothetical protein